MTIGDRLKECRLALGYSAEQIAEKLGISPATMYRYENGFIEKMPSKLLQPLAKILCTTPGYLMGWTDEGAPVPAVKLTPDEEALLSGYRSLNDQGKAYILQTVEMAAATMPKETETRLPDMENLA